MLERLDQSLTQINNKANDASQEEQIYPAQDEKFSPNLATKMRNLLKCFKNGETIKESDLEGLNLPKIGSGGQADIKLVQISDDESYVIKIYRKVSKDNKVYDETIIVNETNEKTETHAMYEVKRLNDCTHPNVLKCFGSTKTDSGDWLLLLDHAVNGDISSFY